MTLILLSLVLGFLLSQVIPKGELATVYTPPTEEGFQKMLRHRGLK